MVAAGQRDYYEVLGVARDADTQTIKNAFRRLAMKWHPDRSREPDAKERFQELAEAYAVLSDPGKRAAYDARGHSGVAGYSMEDLYGGIDLDDLLGGLGFGFGGESLRSPVPTHVSRPGTGWSAGAGVGVAVGEDRLGWRRDRTPRASGDLRSLPRIRGVGGQRTASLYLLQGYGA